MRLPAFMSAEMRVLFESARATEGSLEAKRWALNEMRRVRFEELALLVELGFAITPPQASRRDVLSAELTLLNTVKG